MTAIMAAALLALVGGVVAVPVSMIDTPALSVSMQLSADVQTSFADSADLVALGQTLAENMKISMVDVQPAHTSSRRLQDGSTSISIRYTILCGSDCDAVNAQLTVLATDTDAATAHATTLIEAINAAGAARGFSDPVVASTPLDMATSFAPPEIVTINLPPSQPSPSPSPSPAISIPDGPYETGASITVTFTGATSATDWIGIYTNGTVPGSDSSHNWVYHHGTTSNGDLVVDGTVEVTPGLPGDYFIVMFANDGYVEITDRITLTVVTPPFCTSTESEYSWIATDGHMQILDTDWVNADGYDHGSDDGTFAIDMGFSITYFGIDETILQVSTNGYFTFSNAHWGWGNSYAIPHPVNWNAVDGMVAPYWTDLDPGSSDANAGVFYNVAADNVVVTFMQIPYCCGSTTPASTFQYVINADGSFLFQYQSVQGPPPSYAPLSIGLENGDGTQGMQFFYATSADWEVQENRPQDESALLVACGGVLPGPPTISIGAGPYEAGLPITASFSGASSPTDWIGIFSVGDVPGSCFTCSSPHDWVYHHGTTSDGDVAWSGSVQITPAVPGEYFIVMFANQEYVEITERIMVTVYPGVRCEGAWSECDANCYRTYSVTEPGDPGFPGCDASHGSIDRTQDFCRAGDGQCTYMSGSCDVEPFDYEEGAVVYEVTDHFLCWAHYDVGEDPSACPDYEAATIEGGAMRLVSSSDVVTNWPAYDAGQVYMSWTINVAAGSNAYFNLGNNPVNVGWGWEIQVWFYADGTGVVQD
eukprot:SAG11_NODE_441_length_9431_cov_29.928847_2_plen_761_part_01